MFFSYNFWGLIVLLLLPGLQCVEERYVVNTEYCRIPDPDPFKPDVMKHFKKSSYKACTNLQPLTWLEYNESSQEYMVNINQSAYEWYLQMDLELQVPSAAALSCCYMAVQRPNEKHVKLGDCIKFRSGSHLPNDTDSYIVECFARGKLIYTNGHTTVPERSELRERLNAWSGAPAAPSVLLLGIDTISRLNLMRAMPKTYKYLQAQGWFELAGYNKIADNTLPNLLALLTGYNLSSITNECDPHEISGLDRCKFVWQLYKNAGYVTAFGEDDIVINTFNYNLQGFQRVPVDYYMRPYIIALEQFLELRMQEQQERQTCLGYEHASEHVYNYALEFARRYRNDSFFGVFWTNTHSHGETISRTSAMDEYLMKYLERLQQQGTMEHTIVVLLSDHGTRLGLIRHLSLGWLEERLPFLFMWLPPSLQEAQPDWVQALKLNRNRLSNPYDIYATLQHILGVSERLNFTEGAGTPDCPNCQSVLLPIPLNRSCASANIPDHWCTCLSYIEHTKHDKLDLQLAQFALNHILDELTITQVKYNDFSIRLPRALSGISKSFVALHNKADDPFVSIHRLQIVTQPASVVYEATVRYNATSKDMFFSDFSQFDSLEV